MSNPSSSDRTFLVIIGGVVGVAFLILLGAIASIALKSDDKSPIASVAPKVVETIPQPVVETIPQPVVEPKLAPTRVAAQIWYNGGTLHNATMSEWNAASYENKVATAADFLIIQNRDRTRDLDSLKSRAVKLVQAVDTLGNMSTDLAEYSVPELVLAIFYKWEESMLVEPGFRTPIGPKYP